MTEPRLTQSPLPLRNIFNKSPGGGHPSGILEEDMAILDTVKLAARIKHNQIDGEIIRLIDWSRSEMERAGVPGEIAASDTDPLITDCIVQGCLKSISTDERIRDAAEKSFLYQLDCLRKTTWPEPNGEEVNDGT